MILILFLLSIIFIYSANVSAFCSCEICCNVADGITASGYEIKPDDKFIAAPDNVPFNTKIYIPGYGLAIVKDRGGAIKGNKLDIYFSTHERALRWGRHKLIIYKLKW